MRKLNEVRYISSFRSNLISLSRLDSSGYRWRADDEILKVMHGSRILMKKKKYGGYYLLVGSSVRGEALGVGGSEMRRKKHMMEQ